MSGTGEDGVKRERGMYRRMEFTNPGCLEPPQKLPHQVASTAAPQEVSFRQETLVDMTVAERDDDVEHWRPDVKVFDPVESDEGSDCVVDVLQRDLESDAGPPAHFGHQPLLPKKMSMRFGSQGPSTRECAGEPSSSKVCVWGFGFIRVFWFFGGFWVSLVFSWCWRGFVWCGAAYGFFEVVWLDLGNGSDGFFGSQLVLCVFFQDFLEEEGVHQNGDFKGG